MRILILLSLLALTSVLGPAGARADSFAAAIAIEENGTESGFEWCRANSLSRAKSCALNTCEGNAQLECEFTIWCEPGNWSGVIAMKQGGEVRHVAVCEKASRGATLKALKSACRKFRNAHITTFKSCLVESLVAPNAESEDSNVVTWKYRNGDIRQVQ